MKKKEYLFALFLIAVIALPACSGDRRDPPVEDGGGDADAVDGDSDAGEPDSEADASDPDSDDGDSDIDDIDSDIPDTDIDDNDADPDDDLCLCSTGACCDGCNYLSSDERCSDEPASYEYQCSSDLCGADPQRRPLYRYCSGSSAECTDDLLQPGEWETTSECSDDQLCVFSDGMPSCSTCEHGCEEDHCTGTICEDEACCTDGHYSPPSVQCSERVEASECRCSGGGCGANIECRNQYRFCTGTSEDCGTGNLRWNDWEVEEDCGTDALCQFDGSVYTCSDCDFGCSGGACLQCSTGACCTDGRFSLSTTRCNDTPEATECRCSGSGCGGFIECHDQYRYCTGTSAACTTGNLMWDDWILEENCSDWSICETDGSSASCSRCTYGCTDGSCHECSVGPCCDEGFFAPDTTPCSDISEARQCRCSDDTCGADAECRDYLRHCTGSSADCGATNLRWGSWILDEDCPVTSVCNSDGTTASCESCEFGCTWGECRDCSTGDCCDSEGQFRTSTYLCETSTAYRCIGPVCGGEAQQRETRRFCTGFRPDCDGATFTDPWETIESCTDLEGCIASDSDASCLGIPACGPALNWVFRDVVGPPFNITNFGMAYDSLNEVVVVTFYSTSSLSMETWYWDGTSWTDAAPTLIATNRTRFPMVYDNAREVSLIFGGYFSGSFLGDTWQWDFADWSELAPVDSPPARYFSSMVFDTDRGVSILYGGRDTTVPIDYRDTWEFNGTNWTDLAPATRPSANRRAAMAYDTYRGNTVLFGGLTDADARTNETFIWDGASWTNVIPATSPSTRYAHAMAFDGDRGVVVMFGGRIGASYSDETWEWDGTNWTELTTATTPPANGDHQMAFDENRGVIVMFGGVNSSEHGVWELGVF